MIFASRKDSLRFLVVAVALLSMFAFGCSDEESNGGTTGPESGKVRVDAILFNPKSPAPGDTMTITAVVSVDSVSAPGDYVQYTWTATGGTFIEDNLTTVRWVAPDTSEAYEIEVSARNSVSSASSSRMLFVSRPSTIVRSGAGEMRIAVTDDDLLFLGSNTPPGPGFLGSQVRRADFAGGWTNVTTRPGFLYRFDTGNQNAAHVALRQLDFVLAVWHDDLVTGISVELPTTPFTNRPPFFSQPELSPDGSLIAYGGILRDQEKEPAQGGVDTFRVFVYDVEAQTAEQVAMTSRNWTPSFSSNGNHLVFVSNREIPQGWELWSLPVQGGQVVPDTSVAAVQLTDTGGAMASGTSPPSVRRRQWNPDPANPILAILDTGNKMRLVRADGSGATFVNVAGEVSDFAWARDGERLAMIAGSREGNTIVEVTKAGSAREILSVPSSDRLDDVSWSADGEFLVYSVTRSGQMWYELYDVGGATGLIAPVAITQAYARGNADDYAAVMGKRPVWETGRRVVYVLFFDGNTPRIIRVGLAGI